MSFVLHIFVKQELLVARIISLFVHSRKPLSTHVNYCVIVTSGQIPKMFRGRNTVEKYGGQLLPDCYQSDFGQIKKPLEISGFIIVGSNSLQSVAFFHFPMQNFEKISPRRSEVVISPVMVPRASRLRRRSAAIRSVGRSESSPRRVSSSASAAVRSAS